MSKIEEIIYEIENYIENCKPAPFSGNRKIVVDKDDMQDLLVQLKMRTPEEIKKYQKIISNKDAILANAKAQGEDVIADAKKERAKLLNESDIMQEAQSIAKSVIEEADAKATAMIQEAETTATSRVNEAQEYSRVVVNKANEEAEAVRVGAIEYTDSLLAHVQEVIVNALESYRNNYSDMVASLQADYETIMSNRNELIGEDASAEEAEVSED